jgi:hypothetical protein
LAIARTAWGQGRRYWPRRQTVRFALHCRHLAALPRTLPVQLPVKFAMTLNVKTAKALGVTIPQTLLATANELIQ